MLEAELVEFQLGDAMLALGKVCVALGQQFGKVLTAFQKVLFQQTRIIGE